MAKKQIVKGRWQSEDAKARAIEAFKSKVFVRKAAAAVAKARAEVEAARENLKLARSVLARAERLVPPDEHVWNARANPPAEGEGPTHSGSTMDSENDT